MATSGTYAFSPPLSRLVLAAFARIGVRGPAIAAEHMRDAEFESNLLLCEWANLQPDLWLSELVSVAMVAGTATYTLDPQIVTIQQAYISTTQGGVATDMALGALSTVEYAAMPQKTQDGYPNSYWFNRQITPQITMWPVPDSVFTYTLYLRCVRQAQDASMADATNIEIPYRFYTAFVDGLAERLGAVYTEAAKSALGPAFMDVLEKRSQRSWAIAASQDTESGPVYITPGIGGYFN